MCALTTRPDLSISSDTSFGHRRVAIAGQLTVRTCWELREELSATPAPGTHSLTVDLGEVAHLDAAGLAAVTAPVMQLRRRGLLVSVVLPHDPTARRVAEMSGVAPLLHLMR